MRLQREPYENLKWQKTADKVLQSHSSWPHLRGSWKVGGKSSETNLIEAAEEITQKLKRMKACVLNPLILRRRFLPTLAYTAHKSKDRGQCTVVDTLPEGFWETLPSHLEQVKQDIQGTVSDLGTRIWGQIRQTCQHWKPILFCNLYVCLICSVLLNRGALNNCTLYPQKRKNLRILIGCYTLTFDSG